MRILKVFLILFIPIFLEIVITSCKYNCSPDQHNYTNCELKVFNLDNSGEFALVSNTNVIPKEAYGISIILLRNEQICHASFNSFFFSSAVAFSNDCPDIEFSPIEVINSIKIHTLNEFDLEHPINSEVTEFFHVFNGEFHTINSYLENISNDIDTYSLGQNVPNLEIELLLMNTPSEKSTHQFQVEIELSDGRILKKETSPIELI